jgi:RNase P/RNase MRP subunit p29
MQKSRSMILGLALVLALPAAAMAQSQERSTNSGDAKNVTCRVTNLNATDKSFTADCPEGSMTFVTTSSTQFMKSTSGASGGTGTGGANASMSDIKVGDQVRVSYTPAAGTTGGTTGGAAAMRVNASRVEIVSASTSGSSGSSGSGGTTGTQTASNPQPTRNEPSRSESAPQQSAGQYGTQQAANQQKISGRVASVDRQNRTLVIETAQGRETFKVDQSNTAVDFNSIREGEQVEISFTGTSSTDRRISSLHVTPDRIGQQGQYGTGTEQTAGQKSTSGTGTEQRASQRTGASSPAAGQQRISGRVVNVEDKKIVLETPNGRETFVLDETSTAVDLARFQQGDQVVVMYSGTGANRRIMSIQASGESRASQRGQSGDAQPAGQRLPQTASELPFIGLVGLFLLAAAFGLRYVRRHV